MQMITNAIRRIVTSFMAYLLTTIGGNVNQNSLRAGPSFHLVRERGGRFSVVKS
jgi:hypothetical protein